MDFFFEIPDYCSGVAMALRSDKKYKKHHIWVATARALSIVPFGGEG